MSDREINNVAKCAEKYFDETDKNNDGFLNLLEIEQLKSSTRADNPSEFLQKNFQAIADLERDYKSGSGQNELRDQISRNDLNTLQLLSNPELNGAARLVRNHTLHSAKAGGLIGAIPAGMMALAAVELGIPGPGWIAAGVTAAIGIAATEIGYLRSHNYYAKKQVVVDNLKK